MEIHEIAVRFNEMSSFEGQSFETQILPGDVEVLQITLNEREEFPVFLSITDDQVLVLSYLFHESDVSADKKADLAQSMLEMNIPMPLSSFARIGEQYVVFGAMSVHSSFDDLVHEVVVLSDNTLDAIEALEDYIV